MKYLTQTCFYGSKRDMIDSSFVKATYFWGFEMRFLETKTIIMGLLKTKYEYHIVTGTETGFMCYTICCPFITLIICHNFVSARSNNYRKDN